MVPSLVHEVCNETVFDKTSENLLADSSSLTPWICSSHLLPITNLGMLVSLKNYPDNDDKHSCIQFCNHLGSFKTFLDMASEKKVSFGINLVKIFPLMFYILTETHSVTKLFIKPNKRKLQLQSFEPLQKSSIDTIFFSQERRFFAKKVLFFF